jgi:hypothetical protein
MGAHGIRRVCDYTYHPYDAWGPLAEVGGQQSGLLTRVSATCKQVATDVSTDRGQRFRGVEALAGANQEPASARARNLTLEQEFNVPALAGTKSLHSLVADFGGSHETIRTVLRQVPAV